MNKKYKAFTLFELILVLTVIGVIAAIALPTAFTPDAIDEKKLVPISREFFTGAQSVYANITFKHSNNGSITGLRNSANTAEGDVTDLLGYFVKYLEGEFFNPPTPEEEAQKIPANNCNMMIATGSILDYPELARCAKFPKHVVAGFYIDKACSTSVIANEYLNKQDDITRTQANSCGFIIYQLDNAKKGVLGEDTFVIPLLKKSIKG